MVKAQPQKILAICYRETALSGKRQPIGDEYGFSSVLTIFRAINNSRPVPTRVESLFVSVRVMFGWKFREIALSQTESPRKAGYVKPVSIS